MSERARRLWAGAEADAVGWGGVAAVARATGLAISTVRKGRDEVRAGTRAEDAVRVRRKGGGRRGIEVEHPARLVAQLEKLVSPVTPRRSGIRVARWTCKSTQALAGEMFARYGVRVSDKTVAKLLQRARLQPASTDASPSRGRNIPTATLQFEHISAKAEECLERGVPVLSPSTRRRRSWSRTSKNGGAANGNRKASPSWSTCTTFPAMPWARPFHMVCTTSAPTTGSSTSASITRHPGLYPGHDDRSVVGAGRREALPARPGDLHHGRRGRQQRLSLSRLEVRASADGRQARPRDPRLPLPTGTSKWNKVEHRLFSFISVNWRGRPLRSYETVVNLISNTTNRGGLVVRARLDRRKYPIGKRVSAADMRALNIERHDFRGEWNYLVRPRYLNT